METGMLNVIWTSTKELQPSIRLYEIPHLKELSTSNRFGRYFRTTRAVGTLTK